MRLPVTLSSRDLALLDVACRHRLLTVDAAAQRFFQGGSLEAARSVLRRLERMGLFVRHRFFARETYYQPTESAFALFGDPESKARPIGTQALPRLLGVLYFTSASPLPAVRLRPGELLQLCPGLPAPHPALTGIHDYVRLGDGGGAELTRLLVDLGGDQRAFAFKLRRAMSMMLSEEPFRRLRAAQRLSVTLVFSSELKRDAVRRLLERAALPLVLRFAVVEPLFEVLCGKYPESEAGSS